MREFTYIYRIALAATLLTMIPGSLRAELTRDYMTIVGSATVYPFSQRVIERFIKRSAFKTPRVQTTGSGGGLMLFCMGTGVREPDITYASRRITRKEFDICRANGVREIVEIKIGDDGIVIANSKKAPAMDLSLRDIYLALAKEVPDPEGSKTMVANPYKTWKDVNGSLPDRNIEIMGRTRGSSTFYAFSRLALESGCRTFDWIRALKKDLPGFLDKNRDTIRGSVIDGVKPDFDTIADDSYPISRPLYIYVKKAHVGVIPGIRELLAEYTSDRAWGDDGYLSDVGLIPMPESERRKYASDAENLVPMTR